MIKYFGLVMLGAAGVLFAREYEKKQLKRLSELKEFIRFCEHIKMKISCYLAPKSDWLSDFSSEVDAVKEFLSLASEHSLLKSFEKTRDKLSLGKEAIVLERLFSSLGKAYKENEIELLEGVEKELNSIKAQLESESEKNIKAVKVLTAAVVLGLVILLI